MSAASTFATRRAASHTPSTRYPAQDFGDGEKNPNLITPEKYAELVKKHVMFKDMAADTYLASAGIADWAVQQKCTEVRYYDRWLMGGWVYEERVRARVARANPEPVVRVPLLLAHGQADTDCPFAQIKTFAERAASPLLETLFLEGEGHGPSGWSEEHRKAYFDAIATFLRQNLKPWNCVDNPHGDVTAY